MTIIPALLAIASLPLADLASAERVLGAYIFQRHGDRTAKALPPAKLTDLGYNQEYMSGNFFHQRYISASSQNHIDGISSSVVSLAQVSASAPQDTVIQLSGQAFLQGLYPPIGSAANETLRNESVIYSPMSGYQLIPMADVQSGTGSEDNTWLQSTSECSNAEVSSNDYYYSSSYQKLLSSTSALYQSLASDLNNTVSTSGLSFKNAFTIWDLLNVASIHNASASIPSDQVMQELLVLANTHEFNLAYNSSESIRSVAGMTLAGEVLTALNQTITSGGKSKLTMQFGAYASFLAYFGLAGLTNNVEFTGMPVYASSMTWELVTNVSGTGIPAVSDINVRFLFHNGTSIDGSTQLQAYPLFGQSEVEIPWTQFVDSTNKFAITSQSQWCQVCGNSTGICSSSSDSTTNTPSSDSSSHGMSLAVAGVIGAMVTLGVLAVLTALILLVFNLRLVRKSALAPVGRGSEASITPVPSKAA
jgi:acid phosphatase